MTRIAAYVVLILAVFLFASTSPAWQVPLKVRSGDLAYVNELIRKPDDNSPIYKVHPVTGRDLYNSTCRSCHNSAFDEKTINKTSPYDIFRLITWGEPGPMLDSHYSGNPIKTRKLHPAYPSRLNDVERWGISVYVISGTPETAGAGKSSGQEIYLSFCAECHGDEGYGDGLLASDLVPRPVNLRNLQWLARQSDEYMERVIRSGDITLTGMPGWGEVLGDWEIDQLVAMLRSFEMMPVGEERSWMPESEIINSIKPDLNIWTWLEIRNALPGTQSDAPDWME